MTPEQEDVDAGGSTAPKFVVSEALDQPLSKLRDYLQRTAPDMPRDLVDEGRNRMPMN